MTIRRKAKGKGKGECNGNNEDKKEGIDEEAEEEVSDGTEWRTWLLFFLQNMREMTMASSRKIVDAQSFRSQELIGQATLVSRLFRFLSISIIFLFNSSNVNSLLSFPSIKRLWCASAPTYITK